MSIIKDKIKSTSKIKSKTSISPESSTTIETVDDNDEAALEKLLESTEDDLDDEIMENKNKENLNMNLKETKIGNLEEDCAKRIVNHRIIKEGNSKKIICEIEFESNSDKKILNNSYDYQLIKKKEPYLLFDFLESNITIFND